MEATNDRLRRMANELRRKPTPLSDVIPLMLEAADTIEQLRDELRERTADLLAACDVGLEAISIAKRDDK